MNFLKHQFDKLLMIGLLSELLAIMLLSPTNAEWARQVFEKLISAMLILLTGRAIQRANDNNNQPK